MPLQDSHRANVSGTSGSTSPDLGDMWKYGCSKSPDYDGDIDVRTEGEEFRENGEGNKQSKHEGSAKSLGRALLGRDVALFRYVVEMLTTASGWNIPSECGPHGDLCFFLIKEGPTFHGEWWTLGALFWIQRTASLSRGGSEHYVENFMLCCFAYSACSCKPFLQEEEMCHAALTCHFSLDVLYLCRE